MHACTDMDWDPVMLATSGAYLGTSTFKHQLALVGRVVGIGTGRTKVVVGDNLHDVRRAELGHSALEGEGKVVRLETFKSAQGTGTSGRLWGVGGVMLRKIRFGAGFYRANWFDADIRRGEIAIEKCRIGTIVFFNSAHKLG